MCSGIRHVAEPAYLGSWCQIFAFSNAKFQALLHPMMSLDHLSYSPSSFLETTSIVLTIECVRNVRVDDIHTHLQKAY